MDIDLEKFFDTVDQDRLINIIMRTIKNGDVVSLIRKYLSAGVMDNGVFSKSEKAADRVLASITKYIEKKLGLKVNAEKSKVTRPTQTKYLGFSFWKSTSGKWKPKPHLKSYQKLERKIKETRKKNKRIDKKKLEYKPR